MHAAGTRVLHVISSPDRFGGAEEVLRSLVQGGSERGHEQLVLHMFARERNPRWLAERLGDVAYDARSGTRLRDAITAQRWLRRHVVAFRPDIVHAHLIHAGVAVAALRLPREAVRIWTHHHGSALRDQGRRVDVLADGLGRHRFDAVVAVSDAVATHLARVGYPPSKVHVIRNGWRGNPLPRIKSPVPTAVCVGHFRPEKGHASLITAFAAVRDAVPQARLLLVGDGPLRPALERLTREFMLQSNVTFCGEVADVWKILAKADVFVLPSLMEPLGIAALEAMAAGVPVVATRVGGLPEIVQDGLTGTLVPADDAAQLADAILELFRHPETMEVYSARAVAASAELPASTMVASYFRLYEELHERTVV